MGKLILPGSSAFKETAQVIDLETRRRRGPLPIVAPCVRPGESIPKDPPADPDSLEGKTLMLNLAVCRGFQCGGFQLSLHRSFAVVDARAQQAPIRAALADGRLVDITGQDPKTGFKARDGSVSKVDQEDTGMRVFVGQNAKGDLFVAAPTTRKQAKAFEREITRTGTLKSVDFARAATGLSGITTEDVPLDAQGCIVMPDSKPTRGKISARTHPTARSQRQPRRR
jgi:hypothetical protein